MTKDAHCGGHPPNCENGRQRDQTADRNPAADGNVAAVGVDAAGGKRAAAWVRPENAHMSTAITTIASTIHNHVLLRCFGTTSISAIIHLPVPSHRPSLECRPSTA